MKTDLRQPIVNLRAALFGARNHADDRKAPGELQAMLRLSVDKLDELLAAPSPTIQSRVTLSAHDTLAQARETLLAWHLWLEEGAFSRARA